MILSKTEKKKGGDNKSEEEKSLSCGLFHQSDAA